MDETIISLWSVLTVLVWQADPVSGCAVGAFLVAYLGHCLKSWLKEKSQNKKAIKNAQVWTQGRY